MKDKCKLCGEEKELLDSHVIPKFVFRWMQKTGGGYFRNLSNPNKRIQDGIKEKLLCEECEKKFNKHETWFSKKVFYPYLESNNNVINYDDNLPKFIISVLWRILLISKKKELNPTLNNAFEEWRVYLLNGIKPTNYKDIHLVFIPDEWGAKSQPHEYISRYFSRLSDGGTIEIDGDLIVFAKLSRFFLFGELNKIKVNFRGTQVSLDSGITMLGQYIVNEKINNFFIERSYKVYHYMDKNTSERQKKVIGDYINKNVDRIMKSDLGKSIKDDMTAEIKPQGFKQTFFYNCDCCSKQLKEPQGHLFRTFEIIQSREYWKILFNQHNLGISENELKVRTELFKRIASNSSPWIICDSCTEIYFKKTKENKELMMEWLQRKGDYNPPKSGDFREFIKPDELQRIILNIVTIE